MKFTTIRGLRSNTASLRANFETDRELVVTANGRPFAIMTRVEPDRVEEEILAIRRARAHGALNRIRAKGKADGLDRMTTDEIEAIVAKARRERRGAR